jgi:hypothetical protein
LIARVTSRKAKLSAPHAVKIIGPRAAASLIISATVAQGETMKRLTLAFVVAAGLVGVATADDTTPPAKNDYSIASNWLCLPGHEDACSANEDTTVVAPNGKMKAERFRAAKKAPVDCF